MTKIDLADADYITLVREDIEDFIKGTPLEGSPIVEVDSVSRKGIDELLHIIDKKTDDIAELKKFRECTSQYRQGVSGERIWNSNNWNFN